MAMVGGIKDDNHHDDALDFPVSIGKSQKENVKLTASPLDLAMAKINQKYKKNILQVGTETILVDKIPFTSPRFNYMTYGGIPIGKGTEFFGPEGGGKTTSALAVTAEAQKKAKSEFNKRLQALESELERLREKDNKSDQKRITKLQKDIQELQERGHRRVVYADLENTLDEDWAIKIGVDVDDLILLKPEQETAEQVLQMILDLIETGMVALVVIDSLPMLVSQKVYDESLEKKAYAGIADTCAEFTRRATPILTRTQTALVIINQIREDLKNPDNIYKTPGGLALKHFFSLRVYFRKGSFINKDNEEVPLRTADPAGNMVDVQIAKTKICKPDRRVGQYTIRYDSAIDVLSDTIFMAQMYNMITKSGSWFYIIDPDTGEVLRDPDDEDLKFQGRAALLNYLREDTDLFDEIREAVNAKLAEV